eukprot:TRINITY_DN4899_c0_g2_i2.p1 TRINITY_DN4899_c0_g2~~TRINITY_DN4899_c0_g2_i2.p1  ORF type:complete len:201 (+),score=4.14 TRINITY_DN4899_c0_g2_i2:276-878(+)
MLAPQIELLAEECQLIKKLVNEAGYKPQDLSITRNNEFIKILKHSSQTPVDRIKKFVNSNLNNEEIACCNIIIPSKIFDTSQENTLWSAIIFIAVSSHFMTPALDKKTKTPFTLYTASNENEKDLKEKGVKFYSPKEKLGFHSDGRIEDGKMYIPDIISLYNIVISYRKTGFFYWIPTKKWGDFDKFSTMPDNRTERGRE